MSRKWALVFVNIAHFTDHFFLLIFPTAALAIAPAWNSSYADILVLGTSMYVVFGLATLPAGWLGDRFDRMSLMVIFFLGCGCAGLFIALANSPLMLATGLGLLGLFTAIYHPVGIALVTEIGEQTGRALAINGIFGNMGLAGASVATGIIATQFGWRAAFAFPAIVSLLIGFVLLTLHRRTRKQQIREDFAAKADQVTADRRTQLLVFGVVCVTALLSGLIFNAITVTLPKFLDERLVAAGGNLGWIGASAGLVFAVAAFAQLPVGEMLDRFGARPILCTLMVAQAVFLFALSKAIDWTALVFSLLLVTSLFATIPITGWLLGHYVRSGLRSRAMSVEYLLSLGVGSSVVPLIAFLRNNGYGFDFQYLALAVCAAMGFFTAILLPSATSREKAIGQGA